MVNYQEGKIYKIVSKIGNNCYIGSTTKKYLSQRLAGHKGEKHYVTSNEVIKHGDAEIILIEKFPCNSKDELHARERYWADQINCVNKQKPASGRKESCKRYIENNKDKIKKYQEENKDKIKERQKKYYENNKEVINLKNNARYHKNKLLDNENII